MKVEFHGTPNWQRFGETWAQIVAAKEGLEVVPGSVQVTLKSEVKTDDKRPGTTQNLLS